MAWTYEKNYLCLNQKRCFFILLISNVFVAYIYYLYVSISHNPTRPTTSIDTYGYQKITPAIKFLRNVLENEYDHQNLLEFYDLVDREFSLGLRCARKPKPLPTTTTTTPILSTISNLTNHEQTNSNTSTTRPVLTTSPIAIHSSPVRRPQRSNLYRYSINNSEACSNETIDLVLIIVSKSENYKTRDAIRRTWGSGKNLGQYSSINIKFLFLLDLDEKLTNNIRLEYDLFHDIIQVELPQQYTLVTHRVVSLFEWSFRYCRSAKFLFKTDDDIFVNLILLLKFLRPLLNTTNENSFRIADMEIYGYKHYNPGVFRQANDPVGARYVVTADEFPCGRYPDFLSGFGYLIPKKARDAIVYAVYQNPDTAFRISDVYLTGILPDYLSLPRRPMSDYGIRYQGNCENFFDHPKSFACAAGLHHGDNLDVFEKFNRYWQRVRKSI